MMSKCPDCVNDDGEPTEFEGDTCPSVASGMEKKQSGRRSLKRPVFQRKKEIQING